MSIIRVRQLGNVKGQPVAGEHIPFRAGQHHNTFPFAVAAAVVQMAVGQSYQHRLIRQLLHMGPEITGAPAGVNEQGALFALQ